MIRVGILGTIGSGKSFVAKLFKSPLFDADKEVKSIYKKDLKCFKKLKKILPKYITKFPIAKSEIIEAIKVNKNNLHKISSIVHPIVRKNLKSFLNKNKKKKLIVLDVPLLIENKLNRKNDVLIFVSTKSNKILKRLKKRENFDKRILDQLKQNQVELSKKTKLSNYIVDNNFSPNIMKKKIKKLKNLILNERSSS